MAKRRRKHHRRHGARRRRNPGALLVNPRRRHRRVRRRRNPGLGGIKATFMTFVKAAPAGFIGGATMGFLDAKVFGRFGQMAQIAGKIGTSLVLGALGTRFVSPAFGTGVMTSVAATAGYPIGLRLGGGLAAPTAKAAVKELVEMAEEDDEVAALIEGEDNRDPYSDISGDGDDDDMGDDE